eukprot:7318652-Lingulodinium_polyedra.AAC.1
MKHCARRASTRCAGCPPRRPRKQAMRRRWQPRTTGTVRNARHRPRCATPIPSERLLARRWV